MPFAVVGWLALLLLMALLVLLSVELIQDRQSSRMANLADKIRRSNAREIEF
jgi:HAMP domain-containing protein